MESKAFNEFYVEEDETTILQNLTEMKDKFQSNGDTIDNKVDVAATVISSGDFKENLYNAVKNEVYIAIKECETTLSKYVKDEEKIIDGTTMSLDDKAEHKEIQISFQNDFDCFLLSPTNISYLNCKECEEEYVAFCPRCSKVSHILHKSISKPTGERLKETVPTNILEVRDTSCGVGVYALSTIPEGVIFGPFEESSPVQYTNAAVWKIKNRKLISAQYGNWMQFVNCAKNILFQNLEIFQYKNHLYFRSNRVINEDEQMQVFFGTEYVNNSNKAAEIYYCPKLEEELRKVYACTFCCLGFGSDVYLIKHKMQCPHSLKETVAEIIQCSFCNMFLDREEYLQHHMVYCYERHTRNGCGNEITTSVIRNPNESNSEVVDSNKKYKSTKGTIDTVDSDPISKNKHKVDELESDDNYRLKRDFLRCVDLISEKKYNCYKCAYGTDFKNKLEEHLPTHELTSQHKYKAEECEFQTHPNYDMEGYFLRRMDLTVEKIYNCDECEYGTDFKNKFEGHLFTHEPTSKNKRDHDEGGFESHDNYRLERDPLRQVDLTSGKEYTCEKCEYGTDLKNKLEEHLLTHEPTSTYNPTQHKQGESFKDLRQVDLTLEKEYNCDKCAYGTDFKNNLEEHLLTHEPTSENKQKHDGYGFQSHDNYPVRRYFLKQVNLTLGKEYNCDKCEYATDLKTNLEEHLLIHDSQLEKKHKCNVCQYETDDKVYLKKHLLTHTGPTFNKTHKCGKCGFQTHYKHHLTRHLLIHADPAFVTTYKCEQCDYQTRRKDHFKRHLSVHSGLAINKVCDERGYRTLFEGRLKKLLTNDGPTMNKKQRYNCQTNYVPILHIS